MTLTPHPAMLENSVLPKVAIHRAEQMYGVRYVGDFPNRLVDGGWHPDIGVAVFYRETPPPQYPNRYLGLYRHPETNRLMIRDADYVEGHVFTAIPSRDGIVYSTYSHDQRTLDECSIDGGWDYTRAQGEGLILVRVMNGVFEEVVDESTGD